MQMVDVVIIGAGPVGLFQVFELGLLGIRVHVVDSLEQAGGQCHVLYPDKMIYDIPACPALQAQELVARLLQQIAPFAPVFHWGDQALDIQEVDGGFMVTTRKGTCLQAKAVVIAAGTGLFEPVKLRLPGINQYEGESLHYQLPSLERCRGKHVAVLGGSDMALEWIIALQDIAASVSHVHRSPRLRATPATVARLQVLRDQQRVRSVPGQLTGFAETDGRLSSLQVTGKDDVVHDLDVDEVLVSYGQSPDMSAIYRWQLEMHKNQVVVDTEKFQTSRKGIYAVGDINTYPGKRKLILSGFHESTLAAFAIKEQLEPDRKVCLQYTTSSPLLQKRLGIRPDDAAGDDEDNV